MLNSKSHVDDLAIFGGKTLFDEIKSTSNLVQPDRGIFFDHMKSMFDCHKSSSQVPLADELEARLSSIHGTKHCVVFCNGLWGIILSLKALALIGKKEVIMPSLTYRRMADITAWLNLTPRFCEVSEMTLGITRETVEACITSDTAIILAPHPIVNLCDIDGLCDLSQETGIPLLFDAVEAAHATHNNKSIGSFGDAECFSMHASKFLNGFEGGYVTTNCDELVSVLRASKNNGIGDAGHIGLLGLDANLNEIHAAMTLASVDDIQDQIKRNKGRYDIYLEGLVNIGLDIVKYNLDDVRTFKNILIKITDDWPLSREQTLTILHSEKMLARPYYSPPLHEKKTVYRTISSNLELTSRLSKQYVLLPSGDFLNEYDIEAICRFMNFLYVNGSEVSSRMSRSSLSDG